MKKTVRLVTLSFIALTALMTLSPTVAGASNSGTINIIGKETFNANNKISASFHFSPGHFVISHGGVITFTNLVTHDPHTISIVNLADLPTSIDQVFMCGAPGTVCARISAAHFPNGFDMNGNPVPPFNLVATVPGEPYSTGFTITIPGVGTLQGNSFLIAPAGSPMGTTIPVTISAPAGSTLHYMCAIHPWMQGTIDVK